MPRFFAPISRLHLRYKLLSQFGQDDVYQGQEDRYLSYHHLKEKLKTDIKVDFDLENLNDGDDPGGFGPKEILGYQTLPNGFTFLGIVSGGDWEHPVFWLVYWDGKKIRGYAPTRGNPWNRTTRRAYGNDEEADLRDAKKHWPEQFSHREEIEPGDFEFDPQAILQDIQERIQRKPDGKEHPGNG